MECWTWTRSAGADERGFWPRWPGDVVQAERRAVGHHAAGCICSALLLVDRDRLQAADAGAYARRVMLYLILGPYSRL